MEIKARALRHMMRAGSGSVTDARGAVVTPSPSATAIIHTADRTTPVTLTLYNLVMDEQKGRE